MSDTPNHSRTAPRNSARLRKLPSRIVLGCAASLIGLYAWASAQWSVQPKDSTLTFVAVQADAPFEGAFKRFTADIRFDPQDLASSRFDVKIATGSVDTRDSERDGIIKSAELFDAQRYPSARYVADKFTARNGKYVATGKLTLRDVTRDVPIEFTFERKESGAWLKGTARLKRLEFGVGQGEWRSTETVADDVQVRFALLLKG